MSKEHFPERIRHLKPYKGRFEAFEISPTDRCTTYFATYPAGTQIEAHSHETENCGVITKGELILFTDGKERRYTVGDWYYIPARQIHSARFEEETAEVEFWFPM